MTFQNDWEDFFRKADSGAALAPEEEKCARAIRALRASGKVPPADPAFLDGLWGSLRAEYVRKYAAVRPVRASFFSTWFGPWSAALACLAAVAAPFLVGPSRGAAAFFGDDRVPAPAFFPHALVGFLSLAVAAYSALGALLILAAAWRDRCRRSRARLASDGAAALACSLAFCLAAGVAILFLASLGVDLSWRPFLARAVGFPELLVFAAACAVSAVATVGAVSRAVGAGASGFPRLAATLAAAPWLPTVALYLASPHPSAALANASFLALGTLALAASVWPRVPPAEPLDRFMAMAAVLLVSFPTYAYFFQPRAASAREIFACCVLVLVWAVAWLLAAARRPRWA